MSENQIPFLARDAALAYANSPGTNKNDPVAFGKEVRAVYEAVSGCPTDPVGVRYNNPLIPPKEYFEKTAAEILDKHFNFEIPDCTIAAYSSAENAAGVRRSCTQKTVLLRVSPLRAPILGDVFIVLNEASLNQLKTQLKGGHQ